MAKDITNDQLNFKAKFFCKQHVFTAGKKGSKTSLKQGTPVMQAL
jgi:hypothetical protein